MNPLHATLEEFAADGYTHVECFCPAMPHDEVEADKLASPHLDGPYHQSTVGAAPLCGVRKSVALDQAVANGGCAR